MLQKRVKELRKEWLVLVYLVAITVVGGMIFWPSPVSNKATQEFIARAEELHRVEHGHSHPLLTQEGGVCAPSDAMITNHLSNFSE